MKPRKLLLSDMPLKRFLELFDATDTISIATLGDTMHPSSGYVDESIVYEIETVKQLLNHEYDFSGLVYLKVTIEQVDIVYHESRYELNGESKVLARIENKLRELSYQVNFPHVNILLN